MVCLCTDRRKTARAGLRDACLRLVWVSVASTMMASQGWGMNAPDRETEPSLAPSAPSTPPVQRVPRHGGGLICLCQHLRLPAFLPLPLQICQPR